MTNQQIAKALKIEFNDEDRAVCTSGSPFVQPNINSGDILLTVNGKPLTAITVKNAFKDLQSNPSLYFMILASELQRGVRWRKAS